MGWFKKLRKSVRKYAPVVGGATSLIDPGTGSIIATAGEADRAVGKGQSEAARFKAKYRAYYDPFGYYKKEQEAAMKQAQKESDETQAETERANREAERLAQENLDLATAAQEEQMAWNEEQRKMIAEEKAAREKEEAETAARDQAKEDEANKKLQSRKKRRIALVETSATDDEVLGNTKVGRGRVLGS